MKLKKHHKAILSHRLECDGQVDALEETLNVPYDVASELVGESQSKLLAMVATGQIETEKLSHLDLEVLIDAVEGSTYIDGSESDCEHGEISKSVFSAIEKAYEELEEFIEKLNIYHCAYWQFEKRISQKIVSAENPYDAAKKYSGFKECFVNNRNKNVFHVGPFLGSSAETVIVEKL